MSFGSRLHGYTGPADLDASERSTGTARRATNGTGYWGGTSHNGEGKQRPAQGAALALRTTANGHMLTIVHMYNVISAAARALAAQLTRR